MSEEDKKVQDTVPYERFKTLNAEKSKLAQELVALKAEVQILTEKGATVDNLNSTIQQLKEENQKQKSQFDSFKTIATAMGTMDSDAIETAEWQYSKVKVEDGVKKPSMADWLAGMKENPDTIPKPLSPFMSVTDSDSTTTKKTLPKQVNIGTTPPAATGGVTIEAIRKAKEKARRTGDWSDFKKLSAQIE